MTVELKNFKAENYLKDSQTQAYFWEEALGQGNSDEIRNAISVIAKARGVAKLAEEIGMTKQGLYKAFGENGDPKLSTLIKISNVLGMKLTVEPANENYNEALNSLSQA